MRSFHWLACLAITVPVSAQVSVSAQLPSPVTLTTGATSVNVSAVGLLQLPFEPLAGGIQQLSPLEILMAGMTVDAQPTDDGGCEAWVVDQASVILPQPSNASVSSHTTRFFIALSPPIQARLVAECSLSVTGSGNASCEFDLYDDGIVELVGGGAVNEFSVPLITDVATVIPVSVRTAASVVGSGSVAASVTIRIVPIHQVTALSTRCAPLLLNMAPKIDGSVSGLFWNAEPTMPSGIIFGFSRQSVPVLLPAPFLSCVLDPVPTFVRPGSSTSVVEWFDLPTWTSPGLAPVNLYAQGVTLNPATGEVGLSQGLELAYLWQ